MGRILFLLFALVSRSPGADCAPVTITSQPTSRIVHEGCTVTFEVGATGTEPLSYQWFDDGQLIPDATNSAYIIPRVAPSQNGHTFFVRVSNSCSGTTSDDAALNLSVDVVPPMLLRARSDATLHQVILSFLNAPCSLGITSESARLLSNYSISGGIVVSNAEVDATGTNVLLVTSEQFPGDIYTINVAGICDEFGNCVSPADRQFQAWIFVAHKADPVPPPVSIKRVNDFVVISWPPGSLLQTSANLSGPWTNSSTYWETGSRSFNVRSASQFYRAAF